MEPDPATTTASATGAASDEPGDPVVVFPALCWLALALALVVAVRSFLGSSVPANIPPFPARSFPILGHLPYLVKGAREPMRRWAKQTGGLFSLYFGHRLVVVLNSYDVVHQAFVKHPDTMNDRSASVASNSVKGENTNKGIVTSSGQLWKEQRSVSLQILRSFGMGKNILAWKVSEEVSAYLSALSELRGEPSEVRLLTNTAVANIICSIIVGNRFEYDDTYLIKFIDILSEQLQLGTSSSLFTVFPWLRYLPGDLFKAKRRLSNNQYLKTFFCQHYIEKTEKEYDENNLDNFIAAYLFEMEKLKRQGKTTTLNKDNLSANIMHLFFGGTETISTTLLWLMVYLLHFPHVQEKMYNEIKEVVGTQRAPTMQDRTLLNYTSAVILESQRLASIVPLNLPHFCNADTIINGYVVPAKTIVIASLDAVLWSEKTWEKPLEFTPERFLDAQGHLIQPDEFIPYSIGKRACLGESLAKMELFLFLTGLVQRFELRPAAPGQLPSMDYLEGVTSPPEAFLVRFVDRMAC